MAGKAPPKRYLMPCFPLCASLPGLFSYPLMHPSLHCLSAPGWSALHHFRGPPCSPFSEDRPSPARAAFFPLLAAFIPSGNTLSLPFCPCPPFRVLAPCGLERSKCLLRNINTGLILGYFRNQTSSSCRRCFEFQKS